MSSPRRHAEPAGPLKTLNLAVVKSQFDRFDKDGSGYLDAAECTAALAILGSKKTFEDIDTGGDSKISFDEVCDPSVALELTARSNESPWSWAECSLPVSALVSSRSSQH